MTTYKIKNISETVLGANGAKLWVGKSSVDLPVDAYKASRDALLNAGIAVSVLKSNPWGSTNSFGDAKQYAWAPQYVGLKQDQLNAVFVLGALEAVGELKAGTAQKAVDTLVAALPPLPVDAAGNIVTTKSTSAGALSSGHMTLWLVGGGLAVVGALVFTHKRKRARRR